MKKIVQQIKKLVPSFFWSKARSLYFFAIELKDKVGPYIRHRKYLGVDLYYNRGNSLIKRLKAEPIFEQDLCEAIENELKKSSTSVFIDVGANIGFISTYVISVLPDTKIFAFEPGENQRKLFEKTVSENRLSNITVIGKALGDAVGEVTFHVHDPRQAALDGLHDTHRRGLTTPVKVPMTTLDSWWESAGKPKISVIKIDTEGAELLVLRGAQTCISICKPVIFLEIEPLNLAAYPYNEKDIKSYIENMGYSLVALNKDTYCARPEN